MDTEDGAEWEDVSFVVWRTDQRRRGPTLIGTATVIYCATLVRGRWRHKSSWSRAEDARECAMKRNLGRERDLAKEREAAAKIVAITRTRGARPGVIRGGRRFSK